MTIIINPENSNDRVKLDEKLEKEYQRELSEILLPKCSHEKTAVRKKEKINGTFFVKRQCVDCGKPIGNELKMSDWPEAPEWKADNRKEASTDRAQKKQAIDRKFFKLGKNRQRQSYDRHMNSSKWTEIRLKVLRRANFICEGCLTNNASQAHHLTYENFGDELLFQLVALCTSCHSKLHPEKVSINYKRDWFDIEYVQCSGCRWNGDTECSRFQINFAEALSPSGPCGSDAIGYEELR